MQNAPFGAFCNTFDLHKAISDLENRFLVSLRITVLHRFYCTVVSRLMYNMVCEYSEVSKTCESARSNLLTLIELRFNVTVNNISVMTGLPQERERERETTDDWVRRKESDPNPNRIK